MGLYSASRRSAGRQAAGCPAPGDPNPAQFKVVQMDLIGPFTRALISYHGVTTFEGLKVMVYKGDVRAELTAATAIDPHFTSGPLSPVARFLPTTEGLRLSRLMCEVGS